MKLRLTVAVTLIVVVLAAGVVRQVRSLDGVSGVLCLFENTRYAAGYSDVAFRRVTPGMTEAMARRILGDPLEASDSRSARTDPDRSLFYSYRIERGCYRLRTLLLFQHAVTHVVAECTCD